VRLRKSKLVLRRATVCGSVCSRREDVPLLPLLILWLRDLGEGGEPVLASFPVCDSNHNFLSLPKMVPAAHKTTVYETSVRWSQWEE